MGYGKGLLVSAVLLVVPFLTLAKQGSSPPADRPAGESVVDCEAPADFTSGLEGLFQSADPGAAASIARSPEVPEGAPFAASVLVSPQNDLKILEQQESELADCVEGAGVQEDDFPADDCQGKLLLNFEMTHDGEAEQNVPIGHMPGTTAFFYRAGMTIDADGAPNAYHPDNLGLDDLSNAGAPGDWPGLAKDANGDPYIQGPDDPFPGYYVSETALADRSKAANDPARYVDASKVPFIVLPGMMSRGLGARPGDFAVVFNPRNGKSSYAIFGDVGPSDRIGEGSIALADNLGIRSDARRGGARRGIVYLVFPGSGNRKPRTIEEINAESERLLAEWESSLGARSCVRRQAVNVDEKQRSAN